MSLVYVWKRPAPSWVRLNVDDKRHMSLLLSSLSMTNSASIVVLRICRQLGRTYGETPCLMGDDDREWVLPKCARRLTLSVDAFILTLLERDNSELPSSVCMLW